MKKRVAFQGDVHGDLSKLAHMIGYDDCDIIIQLGDLGAGFVSSEYWNRYVNEPKNFLFIRGNHDDPEICRASPNYLGDFGAQGELFYVSGAFSIDYQFRTPGLDWWYDEELSVPQFEECLKLYENAKPRVVISHDCPNFLNPQYAPTRTSSYLQTMHNIHQPDLWLFGHHHVSRTTTYGKTTFRCLNINEIYVDYIDLS